MRESSIIDVIKWHWHTKTSGHRNMWKVSNKRKVYCGCQTCDEDSYEQLLSKLNSIFDVAPTDKQRRLK